MTLPALETSSENSIVEELAAGDYLAIGIEYSGGWIKEKDGTVVGSQYSKFEGDPWPVSSNDFRIVLHSEDTWHVEAKDTPFKFVCVNELGKLLFSELFLIHHCTKSISKLI